MTTYWIDHDYMPSTSHLAANFTIADNGTVTLYGDSGAVVATFTSGTWRRLREVGGRRVAAVPGNDARWDG